MTLLLVLLVIVFFSGNSLLIGKVFRRWNITINTYLCNVFGFMALMSILYVFFMFLYISGANGFVYIGFISGIQFALIAIYIWNWKYIFVSKLFDKKAIVCFIVVVVIGMLFLVTYHEGVYKKLHSEEFNNIVQLFKSIDELKTKIDFDQTNGTSKIFSVFTVTSLVFKNMLLIKNPNHIELFVIWGNDLNLLFMSASIITSFVIGKKQWKYVFCSLAFAFAYFVIIFLISNSSIQGITWAGIYVIAFVKILFNREFVLEHFQWNNLMVMFLLAAPGIHIDLSMAAIVLGTLFFYNSSKEYANGLSALLMGIFPIMMIIFSWIPLVSWIAPQIIVLSRLLTFSISTISSIIFITIINLTKNSERLRRGNIIVQKKIHLIFGLMSIIYLVLFSFLTITLFDYKISFDIIMIDSIWLIKISENWKTIFNTFSWIFYLVLLITFLIIFIRQKEKVSWQVPATLLIFIFWINPLSCTAYEQIQVSIPYFNYGVINTLFIIFMGTTLFDNVVKNKKLLNIEFHRKKELANG